MKENDSRKTDEARAVALQYEGGASAPRVVAKGEGELARRIIEIAEEHGVPLYQDADLVRLLSRLELDQAIPVSLYQAVAEVLAFIYTLNDGMKSSPPGTKTDKPSPGS